MSQLSSAPPPMTRAQIRIRLILSKQSALLISPSFFKLVPLSLLLGPPRVDALPPKSCLDVINSPPTRDEVSPSPFAPVQSRHKVPGPALSKEYFSSTPFFLRRLFFRQFFQLPLPPLFGERRLRPLLFSSFFLKIRFAIPFNSSQLLPSSLLRRYSVLN